MIKTRFTLFLLILSGCMEVNELSIPIVTTEEPIVTANGVILNGSVKNNSRQKLKVGFKISTGTVLGYYENEMVYAQPTANGEFAITLNHNRLQQNWLYYVSSHVEFDKAKIFGNSVSFMGAGILQKAESISVSSAKANDRITIQGFNFVPGFTFVGLESWNGEVHWMGIISESETQLIAEVPEIEDVYLGDMLLIVLIRGYDGQFYRIPDAHAITITP